MAPKLTVPPSHFALNSIDECCWFKITTFIECPIVGANSQGRIKWATAAPTQKPPVVKQNEPSSRVVDLCHTITYSGVSPSLGCLADTENRYHIFPISETGPAESISESISLESLLSKRSLVRLTRRERYVIALTIACSHLQLHDSPWLAAQWSKKDSLFHCRKNHGIILNSLTSRVSFTQLMRRWMASQHTWWRIMVYRHWVSCCLNFALVLLLKILRSEKSSSRLMADQIHVRLRLQ